MATWDFGGGCPCGINKECQCSNSIGKSITDKTPLDTNTIPTNWEDMVVHGMKLKVWKIILEDSNKISEIKNLLTFFDKEWDKNV